MKKYFLEYFVENPYTEGKINILNHYSHAKYKLGKSESKHLVEKLSPPFSGIHGALCPLPTVVHTEETHALFFSNKNQREIGVWTVVGMISTP